MRPAEVDELDADVYSDWLAAFEHIAVVERG